MSEPVRLIVLPNPFTRDRQVFDRRFDARASLAAIAGELDMDRGHVLALVGGVEIPRAWWPHISPKPGAEIILRRVPTGGGGGKNPLAAILSIASFFVPLAWGPELLGAGALFSGSPAIGLYGALAKGALFLASNSLSKPPSQRLGTVQAADAPTFQLTGASNKAAPYGPVPRVYGRHRVFPPYAAEPYVEAVGGKQYLNCLFDFGYGPLKFEDFRIGRTPIGNYQNVQMEVRAGYDTDPSMTLYRRDVAVQSLSIVVTNAAGLRTIETDGECDEATLGFVFAKGLVEYDAEKGNKHAHSVEMRVGYRLAGTSDPFEYENVGSNVITPSTAVTLTATGASYREYLTDSKTEGTLGLTINMGGGDNWRILTRAEGGTLWVQQAVLSCEAAGGRYEEGIWVSTTGPRSVTLMVPAKKRAEIRVERGAGGATAVPTVSAWSYQTALGGYFTFTASSGAAYMVDARIVFPTRAKYQVYVARITGDSVSQYVQDEVTWTSVNSIAYRKPVTATGHALVAVRIQASEQLNGVIQEFSAIVTSMLKTWDGAAWTDYVETANPAWCYADVICGAANARALDRARLDVDALAAWADDCDAAGLEFNGVFDFRTTVFEAAKDIASVGRASFHMRDGLYSIAQDKAQNAPVQHFTPRNSWGYSGSKRFVDLPHAVKVRFLNRDRDWQPDERIVPDDGYTAESATVFEVMEVFGCDNADQAWKTGRVQIANARLRPEEHSFYADIEHIVCNRGDLIRFSHDVPLFGLGYGRVKTVTLNGSLEATAATLDAEIAMDDGKDYAIRFRRANGASVVADIDTVVGATQTVTFTTPIPAASVPESGDLFLFGLSGMESVELLVTSIEPRSDLSALIKGVDYAPAVYTADTGTIPPFDSQISTPSTWERKPPVPVIESVASDESVLIVTPDGGYQAVMQVVLTIPAGAAVAPEFIHVRWRQSAAESWESLPLLIAASPLVATLPGVSSGEEYIVQARTISVGMSSDYAETTHTVIGASTPPPAVTNLLRRGDDLVWSHEQPRDHAGYLVRYHAGQATGWDNAAAAHTGLVTDTPWNAAHIMGGGGTVTFLVKAIDLAGNESASAATLISDLGDPVVENVIFTHDEHPAFAGTKTNGTVISNELKSDILGTFWGEATAAFWGAAGDTFWGTEYAEMTYEWSASPTTDEAGDGQILVSAVVTGPGYRIDYRKAASEEVFWGLAAEPFWGAAGDPFWAPPPDWSPWPGSISPISIGELDFRLVASGGTERTVVSEITTIFDVPDVTETLEDVAISSDGTTRLPITKSYRAIKAVQLTLQDIGTGAIGIKAFDKDAGAGPLVKTYDATGALVAGSADATITGY